jgi:hypothetical protein
LINPESAVKSLELTPLFEREIQTRRPKAVSRLLRQLAVEHAQDHGMLVPPLATFHSWVRKAVAAHVNLLSPPFNFERAWLRWQNRKADICPAGKHYMTAANSYLRFKPNPHKPGFFKYRECKACRAEKAKDYREKRGRKGQPPKAQALTADEMAQYHRAIERIGPEGLGNELLRWQRALGTRYGRARWRFAKE